MSLTLKYYITGILLTPLTVFLMFQTTLNPIVSFVLYLVMILGFLICGYFLGIREFEK